MRYEYEKYKEKLAMWIAWHLPEWLVYWCAIRLGAYASTTDAMVGTNVPDMTFINALKEWR